MPKDIASLYEKEYFDGHGFDGTVDYAEEFKNPGWRTAFNKERLAFLERQAPGKKILDIGCAMGFFLSIAKKEGWDCSGVELSKDAASHAKKVIGAKRIHNGTLDTAPFKAGSFDCITMFDVIEHLDDPLPILKACRRLLKRDGILMVETANVDSLTARVRKEKWGYYLLGHLVYFSPKTLRRAFREGGFSSSRIIAGDEQLPWKKAAYQEGWKRKIRIFLVSALRRFHLGDQTIGGMIGIAKK